MVDFLPPGGLFANGYLSHTVNTVNITLFKVQQVGLVWNVHLISLDSISATYIYLQETHVNPHSSWLNP